jgi:hypothetical protein
MQALPRQFVMLRKHRKVIALFLCVAWIISLHHIAVEGCVQLRAYGHQVGHSHAAPDDHGHHHGAEGQEAPDAADSHGLILAQGTAKDSRLAGWMLLLATCVVAVLAGVLSLTQPLRLPISEPPRWREQHVLRRWQFVWRCAAWAMAPPVRA